MIGIYEKICKVAKVCPVFENGCKNDISNYRPISVLNNFSKVFEICIYNRVFYSVSPFLTEAQHGFVPKSSTVTNLATSTQYIHEAFNEKTA